MQTSCEVFQHGHRFIWVFSVLSWVYFIAVLLLTVPNTAWLSRTCTAVELKRIWPLRQESHDQGAESCCLASSLSNKLSYFRFQQLPHKRTKCYLDVWWNNTARVHMACRFKGFKTPSIKYVVWIYKSQPTHFTFLAAGWQHKQLNLYIHCERSLLLPCLLILHNTNCFCLNRAEAHLSLMKVYWMLLYGSLVGVAQHLSIRSIKWAGIYETDIRVKSFFTQGKHISIKGQRNDDAE